MDEKTNALRTLDYILAGMRDSMNSETKRRVLVREIEILRAFFAANETYRFGSILDVYCGKESEGKNA